MAPPPKAGTGMKLGSGMKGKGMGIMKKAMEATVKKCNELQAELDSLRNGDSTIKASDA